MTHKDSENASRLVPVSKYQVFEFSYKTRYILARTPEFTGTTCALSSVEIDVIGVSELIGMS